jgi:hypothetical protein
VTDTRRPVTARKALPSKEIHLEQIVDNPPVLTLRKDTPTMNTLQRAPSALLIGAVSVTTSALFGANDRSRYGFAARSCVGVWVGSRVRLDTDPRTDPLQRLTAQVSGDNRNPCSTPTDPSRGLSHGGICA